MKPSVEKKHVFGEKKPRLIRTKRILGELSTTGQSRYSREQEFRDRRMLAEDVARDASNFIRGKAHLYEAGFVARAIHGKTEIELQSRNHSARDAFLKDSPQYNRWQLRISPKDKKGNVRQTLIAGTPFWDHLEHSTGIVSGVHLEVIDPETGKAHTYYGDEEAKLISTTGQALWALRQSDREGTLELSPITPADPEG